MAKISRKPKRSAYLLASKPKTLTQKIKIAKVIRKNRVGKRTIVRSTEVISPWGIGAYSTTKNPI